MSNKKKGSDNDLIIGSFIILFILFSIVGCTAIAFPSDSPSRYDSDDFDYDGDVDVDDAGIYLKESIDNQN